MSRAALVSSLVLCLSGCSGGGGGTAEPEPSVPSGQSGGNGGASAGSGGGLSLGGSTSSGGSSGGGACVAETAAAKLEKQPVDVIVIADTSSSMGQVTAAIEANINGKLAAALESAQLDYRVVVLAGYGGGSQICVAAPLGGGTCQPIPATPDLGPRLLHYAQATGSSSFFKTILDTYNQPDTFGLAPAGWSGFLRAGAKKVFLAFTDGESGPSGTSASFETALFELKPAAFGTKEQREYVFHTFAGFASNASASGAWNPTDPLAPAGCGHPKSQNLQELSIASGGLRFPLCQTQSYDVVFAAIADDVIDKTVVSCDFPYPTPPDGKTLDPNTIQIDYAQGAGGSKTLGQVKAESECDASSFYSDASGVHLCPDACAVVQADPQASLTLEFGCDVGFVK